MLRVGVSVAVAVGVSVSVGVGVLLAVNVIDGVGVIVGVGSGVLSQASMAKAQNSTAIRCFGASMVGVLWGSGIVTAEHTTISGRYEHCLAR